MYSNAEIDSLSIGQLRKLLKGGAVRVRCGSGMKLGLSAPQHKKLMSAHKKGKMMTLTMDPYQMEMHGQGLFGDIGNFFRSIPRSVSRAVEPTISKAKRTFRDTKRTLVGDTKRALGDVGSLVKSTAEKAKSDQFLTRELPSTLIHQGLPTVGSVLGGVGGEFYGGPLGAMAGANYGKELGEKLAREAGSRTGLGLKKGGKAIRKGEGILEDIVNYVKPRVRKAVPHVKKVAKEVARQLARKAGSHIVHNVIPQASERLGEMGGEYFGFEGGKDVGRRMGEMIEQQVAAQTGLGLMMMKRGRPKKYGGALMVAGVR